MLSFVVIKSINMVLNGTRGILLALILGPKSYGLFGTLIVVQQYLSYVALGMREGVAIRLAQSSMSSREVQDIYSSALFWGVCSGLFTLSIISSLYVLGVIPDYFLWVGLISLVSILNEILININRNENRLRKVAWTEFVYHACVLLLVVCFWNEMTIDLALQSILLGLLLGVSGYVATMRTARWSAVSWPTIRELIRIGLLPAVLSAVMIVVNTFYVLAANWMKLGDTIGLVVFANNISVMILFGLNTVAWALASRTMKRLYVSSPSIGAVSAQADLIDVFFRLGVVAAALLALSTQILFSWVMKEYAGSAAYTLYFCVFQAYGLLLFSEANFLSVNSRLKLVVLGYSSMVMLLGVLCVFTDIEFLRLLQLGVIFYFVLSLCIVIYCRRVGFKGGIFTHRIASLFFPLGCVAAQSIAGSPAVIVVCTVFAAANLVLYRHQVIEFAAARAPKVFR